MTDVLNPTTEVVGFPNSSERARTWPVQPRMGVIGV